MSAEFSAAMLNAAASGDVDRVVSLAAAHPHLIDAGHPRQWDRTPAHLAAENGHAAVLEALHRLGSTALDRPDGLGWTPTHIAAFRGDLRTLQTLHRLGSAMLVQGGADLLDLAFRSDLPAVAELVLAAGADTTSLAEDYPEKVRQLLATPAERLLQLREGLYFSSTLLDVLLRELRCL